MLCGGGPKIQRERLLVWRPLPCTGQRREGLDDCAAKPQVPVEAAKIATGVDADDDDEVDGACGSPLLLPGESDVDKKGIDVPLSDHADEPYLPEFADYVGKKFGSIQKADAELDEMDEANKRFSNIKLVSDNKYFEVLLSDHSDEPSLQKFADNDDKKFVSIKKADANLDETEEERKRLRNIKDVPCPPADGRKDSLADLTEKCAIEDAGTKVDHVDIPKRLADSPVVVATLHFGYSAQRDRAMKAPAVHNSKQGSIMSVRAAGIVNESNEEDHGGGAFPGLPLLQLRDAEVLRCCSRWLSHYLTSLLADEFKSLL